MGVFFFVYSILAEQWLINTPPENLKLASRVMIATFHFPIENPDPNKQWNCFANQININLRKTLSFSSFILKVISSIAPRYVTHVCKLN